MYSYLIMVSSIFPAVNIYVYFQVDCVAILNVDRGVLGSTRGPIFYK